MPFRALLTVLLAGQVACLSFEGSDKPGDASPIEDAGATDASTDANPDRDSDGIENGADNCPDIANTGQENEDLDAAGNACDVCPHIDGDQTDDDADGVGNDCDPQPGVANTWLYFTGFDAALDDAEWNGAAGFTVSGGELHSVDNVERRWLQNRQVDHGEKALVSAAMTFDTPLGPNGVSFRYGGVMTRADNMGGNTNNNGCWVLRAINTGTEGYSFVEVSGGTLTGSEQIDGGPIEDVPFEVSMTVDGTSYTCDFVSAGTIENLSRTTNNAAIRNRIGVVSSYINTHVRYLYAISLQ